jgi:hypothetical protein
MLRSDNMRKLQEEAIISGFVHDVLYRPGERAERGLIDIFPICFDILHRDEGRNWRSHVFPATGLVLFVRALDYFRANCAAILAATVIADSRNHTRAAGESFSSQFDCEVCLECAYSKLGRAESAIRFLHR